MTNLEQTILDAIKASGKPLSKIGEEIGVSREQLSRFVSGKTGLNGTTIGKLADYLGLVLISKEAVQGLQAGVCEDWVRGCTQGVCGECDGWEDDFTESDATNNRAYEAMMAPIEAKRRDQLRRATEAGKKVAEIIKEDEARERAEKPVSPGILALRAKYGRK